MAAIFLTPAFGLLFLFLAWPAIEAVKLSFQSWDGLTSAKWVGASNYVALFKDRIFWLALRNTAAIVIAGTLFQVTIPLLIAYLLTCRVRGSLFFRSIYFFPFVISGVITGTLWGIILEPNFGILNQALRYVGLGLLAGHWLASGATVIPTIIFVVIWQSFGFYVILFMAGLHGVTRDIYEAATLDGADALQRFRYVTVPIMRPVIIMAAILNSIAGVQLFDQVWVLTAGGPNHASETLGTYLYGSIFGSRGGAGAQYGYGATIACVVMFLSVCLGALLTWVGREPENDK